MTGKKWKRWWTALAALLLVIGFSTVALWMASRPDDVHLTILEGQTMHKYLPPTYDSNGHLRRFSQKVYFIQADYNDAVKSIHNDLPGWDAILSSNMGISSWIEKPGPFQFAGHQVEIRANRVDTVSFEVLGPPSDSKKWVTVWIIGDYREPNFFRGLWRTLTRNRRP